MMTELLTAPAETDELPPVTYLDASCNGLELSPAEFDAIDDYDEDYEYELLKGVVIVNPIPLEGEADPNGQLEFLLREYQQRHPQGKAIDLTLAERYVFLTDGSRRKADRVIWAGLGRRPQPKTDIPTIVVEFVSASKRDQQRDYVIKRREYLSLGVKEYWIIDRFRGEMSIFRAGEHAVVKRGEAYAPVLLPGFVLHFDALMSAADRWRDLDS